MKRIILFSGAGSNRSSDEVHVSAKINANAVINPLKQKGGFKILKNPIIYFSGISSCLLVLITFTFIITGCEKVRTFIEKENISLPRITPVPMIAYDFNWDYSSFPPYIDSHDPFAHLDTAKVYLINSQEELLSHVLHEDQIDSIPDFNQYSLIVVCFSIGRGFAGYRNEQLYRIEWTLSSGEKKQKEILESKYMLSFTALQAIFHASQGMILSWIIPKVNTGSIFEVGINYQPTF
jgi:hypothetical protein